MNRRAFLQWIAGAASVAALAPTVQAAELLSPAAAELLPNSQLVEFGVGRMLPITADMAQRVRARLWAKSFTSPLVMEGARIGAHGLDHQYAIDAEPPAHGEDFSRTLDAMAEVLSAKINHGGLTRFGVLAIPPGGAVDGAVVSHGDFSLRGLCAYNVYNDLYVVRFDVLGGR